ncbi:flagellar protein [Lachnobacterium bovis]|uniref:Flagellar operon protein TIGR03826 n=1 Tax=Lachnobacterium bovis TaxID=140626 RepID=A0A1H9P0F2_9FIRM|nr:flagellar protein [Lachnobacterium bovis]SER41670.1 hypothetical protein SAMN02910429_00034 [Lachnobacterium bovis]
MEIINCKECGRLFNYLSGPRICEDCKRKIEQKFQDVKQYLEKNPNASLDQIAKDNDVTVKQIKLWIREERLILSSPSPDGILCEKCGKPICTGKLCEECKKEVASGLQEAFKKPDAPVEPKKKKDNKNRMRFLDSK